MKLKKVIKKVESKIQVLEDHIEFLKLSFLIGIRHELWKEINQIGK